MPNYSKTGYYTFLIIYLLAIFSIGIWIPRHQSLPLLLAYTSAFMGYVFLIQKPENERLLFSAGIVARILLFISLPSLSDDLYRFIWDGTLLNNGIDPFEELPGCYLNQNIPDITLELYEQLNSPHYFTVYPPLNQGIFWLSAGIGHGDWLVSANVIRLLIYGADVGSFFLLKSVLRDNNKPASLAHWFWLNPLLILEGVGNLHFEGFVIFFVLLGIWGFRRNKNLISATGFGLAIGTKLLPLIYLPFLFLKGLKSRQWWVSLLAGCIALITLLPMLSESFFAGMQSSLDLYFRSFEFNASIYFVARQIGFWIYGYNNIALIGPILSITSSILILAISIISYLRKWSLLQTFLFILTIYLAFSTTVHPWYILPLIPFGILAGYWYPIVWSFLIFLTYVGYTIVSFELPTYIIVIEYTLVLLTLLLEWKLKSPDKQES